MNILREFAHTHAHKPMSKFYEMKVQFGKTLNNTTGQSKRTYKPIFTYLIGKCAEQPYTIQTFVIIIGERVQIIHETRIFFVVSLIKCEW